VAIIGVEEAGPRHILAATLAAAAFRSVVVLVHGCADGGLAIAGTVTDTVTVTAILYTFKGIIKDAVSTAIGAASIEETVGGHLGHANSTALGEGSLHCSRGLLHSMRGLLRWRGMPLPMVWQGITITITDTITSTDNATITIPGMTKYEGGRCLQACRGGRGS